MELPLHLAARQPVFPGLYRGAVADVDDTTHRGRIKVTVPSVFDRTTPDAAVWAMPCFPWGHVFVPEVGNKVWVAFEDGDPAIASKSGHEILLDDTAGAEKIVIHSKTAAQKIVLDEAPGAEKVTISDKSGCSIELSSTGITIQAPGKAIVLKGASVDVQVG